jgi:ribosomal-protein-alanine N-acetyltransferase
MRASLPYNSGNQKSCNRKNMAIFATNRQATTVRTISQKDVKDILRMVDTAWRIYLRLSPQELRTKLRVMPGFVAEDRVGLRGFILMEPRHPGFAFLVAAGLRDTWSIKPYLDLMLPEIETVGRSYNLAGLAYIGNATWLIDELWQRDFHTQEWIVGLERCGVDPPPPPEMPAQLTGVGPDDLQTLITLDRVAFDQIWHKSTTNFDEALTRGDSLVAAKLQGQIVGYEWCEVHSQHAHLTRLAVHPDFQGRGIGGQLLYQAITEALQRGANRITLNTQESNYRSIALYQRFGFVMTKQRMPVLWKPLK